MAIEKSASTILTDAYYRLLCDCLRNPWTSQFNEVIYHCGDVSGRFRGCHETFINFNLFEEHIHKTGGCRYPGNIEDFYTLEGDYVWRKKAPKKSQNEEQEAYLS